MHESVQWLDNSLQWLDTFFEMTASRGKLAKKRTMESSNTIVNGREADLLLYGEVVENSNGNEDVVCSKTVVKDLLQLERVCDKVRIRINSQGGEVYAGIAIFNALRASKCDIAIYTDGIAASIAGIIAMCGRPHYMSRYSRLMIHSVSGGVYGNKTELARMIDEITSLEETIGQIIALRMNCSLEDVKQRYFDGSDHWFTAEEAVSLGLADGIYDSEVAGLEKASPAHDIYNVVLNNRLAFVRPQTTIKNNMELEKIKKIPKFANVASEEEAVAGIAAMAAENEALKQEKAQLQADKQNLEAKVQEVEDEQVENILNAAVEEGKIQEGQKETYRNLLKADRVSAQKVINSLKKGRSVADDLHKTAHNMADGAWDKRQQEIRNSLK